MEFLWESIDNQTSFSQHLFRLVCSSFTTSSNLVLSPISIHAILTLIAAGSKDETLKQIVAVSRSESATDLFNLSFQIANVVLTDRSPSGGPKLFFANGVWIDASILLKSTFKEVISSTLKSESRSVDFISKAFEARLEVNSWVENKTNGLIKEILPDGSVDDRTRLILGNALYFKGAWSVKFHPSQTKDSEFYLLDGSTVQTPFMTSQEKQYIAAYDGFRVLGMPYKQGEGDNMQFSMYIFLPESRVGLSSLTEKLNSEPCFLSDHIPLKKVKVGKFKIPKFKISFGFEASEVLKSMGLTLPFSNSAELTEMVDSGEGSDLCVSSIHHKAFVEVNEEGTEAAAATAAVFTLTAFKPSERLDFVADHPFAFVIREDMTGLMLFMGRVMNPSSKS